MRRGLTLAATAGLMAASPATAQTRPTAMPPSPAQIFGPLYQAVEMRRIFPDSKTFADAVPKRPAAAIMAAYRACACDDDAGLRRFVAAHFALTPDAAPRPQEKLPLVAHIDRLWPQLTRTTPTVPPGASALPLPRPYVVPGGRFAKCIIGTAGSPCWACSLGAAAAVEDMIVDFGSLIDRYGHIPNGTRSYYLSRSQPPFFYLIAAMSRDPATLATRTRQLRAEHDWWMRGAEGLAPGGEHARVVRLADGTLLNRYWDDRDDPRDESYREDAELAAATPDRDPRQLYRDLRAAAESGWDFSSRWLGDRRTLATIRTTRLLPVDLNSLMVGMERALADHTGRWATERRPTPSPGRPRRAPPRSVARCGTAASSPITTWTPGRRRTSRPPP